MKNILLWQIADADQEGAGHRRGLFLKRRPVEETVRLVFDVARLDQDTQRFALFLKCLDLRIKLIGRAVDDECRRQVFGEMLERRDPFYHGCRHAGEEMAVARGAARDQVNHGIIQYQRVGFWGNGFVVGGGVDGVNRRGAGGKVAAGGAARGHDTVRVNAEFLGVGAHPAHRADGVLDAFIRENFIATAKAVIGAQADNAFFREIFGLRLELHRRAGCPAAAKKENDRGAPVGGFPVGGFVDRERELARGGGFVDFAGFLRGLRLRERGGGRE